MAVLKRAVCNIINTENTKAPTAVQTIEMYRKIQLFTTLTCTVVKCVEVHLHSECRSTLAEKHYAS